MIHGHGGDAAGKGFGGEAEQGQTVRPARHRDTEARIRFRRLPQRRCDQRSKLGPPVWLAQAVHFALTRWRPASAFCVSVSLAP